MKSIMEYFMQSSWLKDTLIKNKLMVGSFMSMVVELARDDPRRVIHSFKVGLAISFVSLFYYCKPLYDDFGVSIMWALMTVVVVSEFSVGATLGKGVIRGIATMLAGALGIGAHHVANRFGHVGERAITGFLVFLLAAVTTFMRFVPNLKSRYDSGLLVFILTFSFMSVSGYGDNELLEVVRKRVSTIMIGALVSVVVSMALFPVWAGEDLHDLVAGNLEKLGNFMEGFGNGYFEEEEIKAEDLMLMMEYKSILNSKNNEDSLANFARWEPGHGRFKFNHPWKQYLELGALARQCAYKIESLNRYLTADVQPRIEIRLKIKEPGKQMSLECGRALKQMSEAIKAMSLPCAADNRHVESAKSVVKALNSLLKSEIWQEEEEEEGSSISIDLLQVAPVATVASLLIDMVNCIESIGDATFELASKAAFDREVLVSNLASKPDYGHVEISVNESGKG